MKRILVVSDNPLLVNFFRKECTIQGVKKIANIKYCYSSVNKSPNEMTDLGATPIDFKNPQSVAVVNHSYDLILSLHCKQIFPPDLVTSVTCINVHPGFNPFNRGWYPQVFSIINGKPIGATIHLMDKDVDHGGIIDQSQVEVRSSDTSMDLYERVIDEEKRLIRNNLLKIINGKFSFNDPYDSGNYNSIDDFKSLCHLDLDALATLREHINLLRATSHGAFKNAYFFDEHGNKVFIRITLEEESR